MSIFDYRDSYKEIERVPCELVWESPDCPKAPELSIIMPVYINHDFFRQALRSAIDQDWKGSYEIVVVDNDTSPDNPNQKLIEEFNEPRVRYFRNAENIGMVGNWNRGIIKSRAQQVTFLHDDDMFLPATLSTAMAVAARYPGKMVISTLRNIDLNGEYMSPDSEYDLTRRMYIFKPREVAKVSLARALCTNMGNLVGAIFNRDNLIALGGFHEEAYPPLDYEMAVRYCHKYGAIKIRRPNALYRIANNTSHTIYATMAPKQREIAEDMIRKIQLPYTIMRRIADTFCNDVDTYYRRRFGPADQQVQHVTSSFNRLLTSLYISILNLMQGYKLSL